MEKEYYKYDGVKLIKIGLLPSNSSLEKERVLLEFEGSNLDINPIIIPTAKLYYLIIKNLNNAGLLVKSK